MNNPYRPKSMIWALMEEDWSDLTAEQIAEVFGTRKENIRRTIYLIKKQTGYEVPYIHLDTHGREKGK